MVKRKELILCYLKKYQTCIKKKQIDIIELTTSSMCLDKHVEEEWNTLNIKCIDSAKLYKLVDGKPVLVKEKQCEFV